MRDYEFSIANFCNQMNNPDEDYAVIEMQKAVDYLDKAHKLPIPEQFNQMFVSVVLQKITSKKLEAAETALRLVVLLVHHYAIDMVSLIINELLVAAYDQSCDIMPHIISVFKEILGEHEKYEENRNQIVFDCTYSVVLRNIISEEKEGLDFTLELFTSLLENIGYLATKEQLKDVLDRILAMIAPDASADKKSRIKDIATFAMAWSKHAMQSEIGRLIEFIFSDDLKKTSVPLIVTSAVVKSNPMSLEPYVPQLLDLYFSATELQDCVDVDNDENGDDAFENKEGDRLEIIKTIQKSIESLTTLLATFPQMFIERPDKIIDVFFKFVDNGVGESEIMEEEPDEMEMEMDFGSDAPEPDDWPNEEDNINNTGSEEDTWKLRKAATNLGTSLVHVCPDQFLQAIITEEHTTAISHALADRDEGSKKDILGLLVLLILTYKEAIPNEIESLWVSIVCQQIKQTDSNIDASLSALSSIALHRSIAVDSINDALSGIFNKQADSFTYNVVDFCVSILKGPSDLESIIPIMAQILLKVIDKGNGRFAIQAIDAAGILFSKKIISNEVIELNSDILICHGQKGEKMSHTIPVFSVFIVSFNGENTTSESLIAITSGLNFPAISKHSLSAICLIASSPQREALMESAEEIFAQFITLLEFNDQSVVFSALWCIRLYLEHHIISPQNVSQYVDNIMELYSKGIDMRSRIVLFIILSQISKEIDIYDNTVLRILKSLTLEQFPDEEIVAAASFLSEAAIKAPEKMTKDILSLFPECDQLHSEAVFRGVSSIIGNVASACNVICDALLDYIKTLVVNIESPSPFALLCLGEIFSLSKIDKAEDFINILSPFLDPERPRAVFSAASISIGYVASGNANTLLPLLLEKANQPKANFIIWLKSIESFLSRLLLKKVPISSIKEALKLSADFLLQEREIKIESSQTLSESLASLVTIDNSFLDRLLEIASQQKDISPAATSAVSIFFSTADEDIINKYLPHISNLLQLATPDKKFLSVSASSLLCLKYASRYSSTLPFIVQQFPAIFNCAKFDESHKIATSFGFENIITDYGKTMRCAAIELLSTLQHSYSAEVDPQTLVNAATMAIQDPDMDVTIRALSLLTRLAIDHSSTNVVSLHVKEITEAFKVAHPIDVQKIASELEMPLFTAIVATIIATKNVPYPELENVKTRYNQFESMKKAENNIQSMVYQSNISSTKSSGIRKTIVKELLSEYNPEAAIYIG